MDADQDSTPREDAAAEQPQPPVQHCPFCGESIGSFWGRRGDDGSHWCKSCQLFFTVDAS